MALHAQAAMSGAGKSMLWGGCFTGEMDPLMAIYNESLSIDRILYAQDIAGSIAWARANKQRGILTSLEFDAIVRGFQVVLKEWQSGSFKFEPADEDIHTANERRLGEVIGKDIAGKLHTGRSRNEQIACDIRLWLREELQKIDTWLSDLLRVITARSDREIGVIMPGYTHLQRAQPVRWSHWMLNYGMSFATDLQRLRELTKRVNRSPLGCGALAGNPFGIDREAMAKELGFEGLLWNSMSAVADRDFLVETLQWGAMLMGHMSRLAEDLIVWSSAEFEFVRLSDSYSTGSSLMPQKKNPDSLEIVRGKSGRVLGHMVGVMHTLKGIPSTYNKDMQECLEPLLDGVKTVGHTIQIVNGVLSTLAIQPDAMLAALTPDMLATDLADHLVRKGVPFRETHHISGQVVSLAKTKKMPIDMLSIDQLQSVDSRFDHDVMHVFDYERSVEMRSSKGGTCEASVKEQIGVLQGFLDGQGGLIEAWGSQGHDIDDYS